MFTKEETDMIINIITNLDLESEEEKKFQKKLNLLKDMMAISDEAQSKLSKIQDEINALNKKED